MAAPSSSRRAPTGVGHGGDGSGGSGGSEAVPTAVFVSGDGTNLQSVIDDVRAGRLPLDLRLIVCDKPGAFALERARRAGLPCVTVPFRRGVESRAAYSLRVAWLAREARARLVLLLGWMIVLSPEFLGAGFEGVLNLHPSWLPDDPSADRVTLPDGSQSEVFRGPHALRDALAAGVATTGATFIQITSDVDRGPVLARRLFELRRDDTVESALERLHPIEHEVVREGILRWLSQRRELSRRP